MKNNDGVRFSKHDSFEYVYSVSKLSTQAYFFVMTIMEIIEKELLKGIDICFFGDSQKTENERTVCDKIKIIVK